MTKKKQPIKLIIKTAANFVILMMFVYVFSSYLPIVNMMVGYKIRQLRQQTYKIDTPEVVVPEEDVNKVEDQIDDQGEVPTKLNIKQKLTPVEEKELLVIPASTDFGLVIEKIGVNVPVVADVDSSDYGAYTDALRYGVVHAKGTSKPGEGGNIFIHGHSSLGFWQLGNYATVFTLLSNLEPGDLIVTFYQGKRYDYIVNKKEIVAGYDITPLVRDYEESVLTIQTCDPPGTTLNRLIITARLLNDPN